MKISSSEVAKERVAEVGESCSRDRTFRDEQLSHLRELAKRIDGAILYVGKTEDAIPSTLDKDGNTVHVIAADSCSGAEGGTDCFDLMILPLEVYKAAGAVERRHLIETVAGSLAVKGLLIVDELVTELMQMPGDAVETEGLSQASIVDNIGGIFGDVSEALYRDGFVEVHRARCEKSHQGSEKTWHHFRRRTEYPLIHPFSPIGDSSALVLTSGEGCTVRDVAGTQYLDFGGGLFNVQVGLGDPDIISAITAQLTRLSYGTLFAGRGNEPSATLAHELRSITPRPLDWVYLVGSGSEATEIAIRNARLYHTVLGQSERRCVVYLDESFHGTFAGGFSVSGLIPLRPPGAIFTKAIKTPNTLRCPRDQDYGDFALECANELEEAAQNGDVAAFIVEPILASAGVVVLPQIYFDRIAEICDRYDLLLVVDEVATGFGRTGRWLASEHYGIKPDMLLLAKGMNSGYLPLGAVLFSARIGDVFQESGLPFMHGSTYNGHPACCASALANISILRRRNLVERCEELGVYFRVALETLLDLACVREVRGLGLMLAIVIAQEDGSAASPAQLLMLKRMLQDRGLLILIERSTLVFAPAFVIEPHEIDSLVRELRSVLSKTRLSDGKAICN